MTAPVLSPSDDAIARAVSVLKDGGLVVMPTETVYGLACDASNSEAVARLYAAKGRPSFNPLIAHIPNLELAQRIGDMPPPALDLARKGWPGPLTLVVPLADQKRVCDLARAGLESIALRIPAHPIARKLLNAFNGPLVAPSANPSGRISPTTAAHVASDMGDKVDLILDGGACEVGLESTIVSCLAEPPVVLRHGAFDASHLDLGKQSENKPLAPGGLSRHYAPHAELILNVMHPPEHAAYLGFGAMADGEARLNLSATGDLTEAAANLFAMLRTLDAEADKIAVAPIPMTGLGLAINDRLARAAKRD